MLNDVRLTPDGYVTDVEPFAAAEKDPQIIWRPFWSLIYPGSARVEAAATIALKALAAVVAPVPPLATATVPVTLAAVPVVF
jgi:hypothetical protein